MSVLVLVRHAQASFFEKEYDKLSALGEQQARRLGQYFIKRGVSFDEIYTGPASRHMRTAELVAEELRNAGRDWPEATVDDDLQEHSADQLLKAPAVASSEAHPHIRELVAAFRDAKERGDIQKSFQKLFEAVVLLWTEGEFQLPGAESWQEFDKRVRGSVKRMTEVNGQRGRRILAFSSVGPISVALQAALNAPLADALNLGWRLRNCSVTSFLFNTDRMTLDSFNSVAHLENPDEVTYR